MHTRTALMLALAVAPAAAMAQNPSQSPAPLPPPTPDQVKACVQQVDLSRQWSFDWKAIVVGQPRHPRNPYERAGLPQGDADFGYPVHVTYVFNHQATVDSDYWMTHDKAGRWWIVAVCRPG
jgi:hypothetical protein